MVFNRDLTYLFIRQESGFSKSLQLAEVGVVYYTEVRRFVNRTGTGTVVD